jgi:hypothetical protein
MPAGSRLATPDIDDLSLLLSKSVVLNLFKAATPLNKKKKFCDTQNFLTYKQLIFENYSGSRFLEQKLIKLTN